MYSKVMPGSPRSAAAETIGAQREGGTPRFRQFDTAVRPTAAAAAN